MSQSASVRNYRIFAVAASSISIVLSLMVLAGWWLRIPALTSIVPGLAGMKPNTALCFILSAVALWLFTVTPPGTAKENSLKVMAARLCASVVTVVGSISFAERFFAWAPGIDELMFHRTLIATNIPNPGLMAKSTALCFVFLGTALFLLDWETRKKQHPAQAFALCAMAIGLIAVLGYLFGSRAFLVPAYTTMAMNTAGLFLLLGTGTLTARPDKGVMGSLTSNDLGGVMARRLLPPLIVLPVFIAWVRMKGQLAGYYGTEFGLALFTSSNIVIISTAVWISAVWLNRADRARRHAEQHDEELAAIVASSSDAIIGKTLDGMITSWNKGAERLYGYTQAEVLGKSISILVPAAHLEDVSIFLAQIRKGMPVERFETARQHKNRSLLYVSLTISPVHDREGNIIGASTVARDITERKRAEERLHQSQAQLKGIIDSAMDAVITINQAQNVAMFNASAERMFGYSANEVLGLPLQRLIPPALRPGHEEHIRNFSKTGITNRAMGTLGQLKGLHKDGTEFPIEASISQVETGGNKFFTAIVRDVTERVRADSALREQASVLNLAQVLVRNMDDRIVLWNRGAEKLYGFTLEEALGRTSHELLRTEFPEPVESIMARLMSTDEWEGELAHRKRDGSQMVVASVWTLERNANGTPWRVLEANTDITERKHAENALQLAQARLLSALEGGRMGTWVWDISKNQIDWDNSMAALFGRSPRELSDGSIEPFFTWVHPEDRERTRTDIDKVLYEGTKYDSEYRIIRPDKSVTWITSRGTLERDEHAAPFRMTGICVDITDRKKMEEQLIQSQKMESLGTLAGGIAHDFNNILLAIGGNASLAIDEIPKDHPAQQSLNEIAKAGARASSLVRQILAFSRRQTADRKRIAIQPVVEEALALLRATLPARIEIRAVFAPDIPAILGDSTQLHQIIMNLGTNASRAMGVNQGLLEVTATTFKATKEFAASVNRLREGQYVRISVSDNGCGMDAATVERIFDPFFTTQAPGEGTGLGLSVVHGIIKDHDGAVSVYSERGKGTIFNLYFPAAGAATEQPRTTSSVPTGNGERLLYVDDEEALVMLAKRSLGKLGYEVTGHSDPKRALQAFRENPDHFAAVITDLSMPGMSGADLVREIIALRPDVPVVMTSGYIRPEDEAEARKIGVREMILKPDTIEELAKALHRVFSASKAER